MAKIKYNGNITDLATGKSAVINCKGKKFESDVIITGACKVDYEGNTVELTENQSIVAHCKNKKMASDVIVRATESGGTDTEQYTLSGTWVFNDTITIPNGENLNYEGSQTVAEVEFTSASTRYSSFCVGTSNNTSWNFLVYEGETSGYVTVYMGEWLDQAYRTITFDGTQTVSKEFYDWFTANAVEQITDLTGTKWKLKSTNCTAEYGHFNVIIPIVNDSFIGGYNEYLYVGHMWDDNLWDVVSSENSLLVMSYIFPLNIGDTFVIGGGTDATNPDLIVWVQEHAEQIDMGEGFKFKAYYESMHGSLNVGVLGNAIEVGPDSWYEVPTAYEWHEHSADGTVYDNATVVGIKWAALSSGDFISITQNALYTYDGTPINTHDDICAVVGVPCYLVKDCEILYSD